MKIKDGLWNGSEKDMMVFKKKKIKEKDEYQGLETLSQTRK
jgi:hypothetical protein